MTKRLYNYKYATTSIRLSKWDTCPQPILPSDDSVLWNLVSTSIVEIGNDFKLWAFFWQSELTYISPSDTEIDLSACTVPDEPSTNMHG